MLCGMPSFLQSYAVRVRKQDYFQVEVTEPLAASALQTVPARNSANNPRGTQHASDAPNRNAYIMVQLQQKMCYSVVLYPCIT